MQEIIGVFIFISEIRGSQGDEDVDRIVLGCDDNTSDEHISSSSD
jgi:hypothetical protein